MSYSISIEELGTYLKEKRKELGYNLLKVEEKTGVSPSTLSRIERGHIPDIDAIRKLSVWLEVSIQAAGESKKVIENDKDLKKAIEVHLRANKNLSDNAAKGIAQSVEAFMAWEIKRAEDEKT